MSLNKSIDKAQQEAATIQNQGVKNYIWSKRVSMSLGAFLITALALFIAGAIIF